MKQTPKKHMHFHDLLHQSPMLLAILAMLLSFGRVNAQEITSGWSEPQLVTYTRGSLFTPLLLADATGQVHLIYKVNDANDPDGTPGRQSLFYSQLVNGNWSEPVNFIDAETIASFSAVIDSKGILHVVWVGAPYSLYYAHAAVKQAMEVSNWSQPITLGDVTLYTSIAIDAQDRLFIFYAGYQLKGIYFTMSSDEGQNWTPPALIAAPSFSNSAAAYPQAVITPQGKIHLVWTEFTLPTSWPPIGVFYTHSSDLGETWAYPTSIANGPYDEISIAVAGENMIHTVWNGMITIAGRYQRWSEDGGNTWTRLEVITKEGGTEGPPALVVDATGNFHLLTTFKGCPWLYSWLPDAKTWGAPDCLKSGKSSLITNFYTDYTEEPAMTISTGNILHAVFWDNRQKLWYAYRRLDDVKAIPTVPWKQPTPTSVTQATQDHSTPTAAAILTNTPALTPAPPLADPSANPLRLLLFSLIPTFGFLAIIFAIIKVRADRR